MSVGPQGTGTATFLARNGHIVDVQTMGLRDREAKLPMERDTIFRIYSMSKVVTSVAALMLVEEGRLRLEDPVARHLPELKVAKVFTGGTADAPTLVDAKRPITVRHLFTHTSGYGYGFGQELLVLLFAQHFPYNEHGVFGLFNTMMYAALVDAPAR